MTDQNDLLAALGRSVDRARAERQARDVPGVGRAGDDDARREQIARAIARGLWPDDSWDAEAKDGDLRDDDREECLRAADAVLPLLAAERAKALRDLLVTLRSDQYRVLDDERDPYRQGWRKRSVEVVEALEAALAAVPEPAPGEEAGDERARCIFCCWTNDGRTIQVVDGRFARHLGGEGMACVGSGKTVSSLPAPAGEGDRRG